MMMMMLLLFLLPAPSRRDCAVASKLEFVVSMFFVEIGFFERTEKSWLIVAKKKNQAESQTNKKGNENR